MEYGPMTFTDFEDANYLSMILTEKVRSASVKSKADTQMTIFRVPDNIRMTNVGSFEPKIVSLGPYHQRNQRLRATSDKIKWSYASNFFGDTDMMMNLLPSVVERFKRWESTSRGAYSELIGMTSYEFVGMMMLDCAFMAEFLKEKGGWSRREEEYSWEWAAPWIVNDMLLVENQFPLRLLVDLHEIMKINWLAYQHSLRHIMQHIHENLSPTSNYKRFPDTLITTSAHLLHLFHSVLVGGLEKAVIHLPTGNLPSFPSAEMLQGIGIQFANKTYNSSLLDIAFDERNRIMEIPQLVIDDDNISLLRNLIAFEQQCHGVGKYISAYVWFMDCLINTGKDVAVLRKHDIIVSRLRSDEEVVHIFNVLRRTDAPVVDIYHSYLAEEIKNVNSYCTDRSTRLWAIQNVSWLRQNYFINRWVTIVVIVTIFFNFLTLVQTVFAILSYAKQ